MRNNQVIQKAPKLRFKPGQFLKYGGQLYCVIMAFRYKSEPNVWLFELEERKTISNPQTGLSGYIETFDQVQIPLDKAIVYEPIRTMSDLHKKEYRRYRHGDSTVKSTQDLINKAQIISSGEVS